MVGFGKKLRERQVPEWKDYYISYKMMKRKLKQYAVQASISKEERHRVLKEFSLMLDRQVEKTVLFLLDQQGQLAHRLADLADQRIAAERDESGNQLELVDRTNELIHAYRDVGDDLLKLLLYAEVNATGLRKILKKFDKRVGYRLTDDYVTSRSNHPYSQLQQVMKHVGIAAMVATLSRNLVELSSSREGLCIYEMPSTPSFYVQEPVINAIKAAEERLTNSTNFMRFLGQAALLPREDLPSIISAEDLRKEEEQYHFFSLGLNLGNTFLYMVNTYVIVPTADKYTESLNVAPTVCGIVIGAMAVAQLVSSVYFSAWSNTSYYQPLLFSSVMLLLGNVAYAVAYDYRSISLLLVGRLLCGFGSARAVNRRYISDCVPTKMRLQASAAFVSASALGMAAGPGMAGFLTYDTTLLGFTINDNTLPGWVMAIAWLLYLVVLCSAFKEPMRTPSPKKKDRLKSFSTDSSVSIGNRSSSEAESGLLHPLLSAQNSSLNGKDSESDEEKSDEPASSIGEAYRLLTAPVKVQLLIYFMLKFAMEILLSESSVLTEYYFGWEIHHVSLFLGLLGLTVLPVNYVVGSFFSNVFEDRQILLYSEIFTCVGIVFSLKYGWLPYTMTQYICGAVLIFVSAEVLEGVNLALLSKVMSSKLARGTWNGGLLSTEAGTLARVVADASITLAGYLGNVWLLNATMLPTLLIGVGSVVATLMTYNSMF